MTSPVQAVSHYCAVVLDSGAVSCGASGAVRCVDSKISSEFLKRMESDLIRFATYLSKWKHPKKRIEMPHVKKHMLFYYSRSFFSLCLPAFRHWSSGAPADR